MKELIKQNNKMYKRILVLLVIVSMAACSQKNPNDKKAELEKLKKEQTELQAKIAKLEKELNVSNENAKVTLVSATAVEPGAFNHYLEVQGRVDSDENLWITPKVPTASVTSVRVQRGDKVSKGQVLATLDAGPLAASVSAVRTQLELATTVYKKQKNLWDQKIGTEIQYLNAKTQMEALQSQVASLQEQLDMYTLRSAINGTVDDVNLKVGENPTPVMSGIRVVNYAKTKVLADISENYTGKIKAGDDVIVFFPDINKEIRTKVRTVSNAINTTSRTFTIEVAVDAKEYNLHPNMIARVKINDYSSKSAITVPVNCVQQDEKGSFVYVVNQEGNKTTAKKAEVKTGLAYNGQVEVTEGLNPGQKVITTGYQNVVDGQTIELPSESANNNK